MYVSNTTQSADDMAESLPKSQAVSHMVALLTEIQRDGAINESEVQLVRALLDAEGMDLEKGNVLFDFKDKVQKTKRIVAFEDLFVEKITEFLLEDETSPGEIDEQEAKWLRAKIQAKGYIDSLDRRLLRDIKSKSINFPEILNFKNKYARAFENGLYLTRYLTFFAVIGSALAAVALFVRGSMIVFDGIKLLVTKQLFTGATAHGDEEHRYETLLEMFVSSVDIYLFAMVLIIFSVGVYELFINKIDPVVKKTVERPSWLQISSIDDLKSSLGKVILMVLIVSFFKHSLELKYNSVSDLLQLGIGVILVAGALYIAHQHHPKEGGHNPKKHVSE